MGKPLTSNIVRGEGGVHAIEDALKLSQVLGHLDVTDANEIATAVAGYHVEVLARGVEAVKKSRAVMTEKNKNSVVMAWGHPAVPMPEENLSLSSSK
jgi:hypothetical protein